MLKRGYQGTYHKMSPKHLERYINEFSGRHNVREADTIDHMEAAVTHMIGKHLAYRTLIADTGFRRARGPHQEESSSAHDTEHQGKTGCLELGGGRGQRGVDAGNHGHTLLARQRIRLLRVRAGCEAADGGEYLYDVTWLDYEGDFLTSATLVAECEWGNLPHIDEDFQKLLFPRADVRLMIFDGNHPPFTQGIAEHLARQVRHFRRSADYDSWLFAAWEPYEGNERGWQFRWFTITRARLANSIGKIRVLQCLWHRELIAPTS